MITSLRLTALTGVALTLTATGRPVVNQEPIVPPSRAHHALVFDEGRGQVLLTGGSTPLNGGQRIIFYNDTWTFDGTRWRPLGESGEKMSGMRLIVDSARRVRSIGGFNGGMLGQLRNFDGRTWKVDADEPSIKGAEQGVVYDTKRQRVVLFGGSVDRTTFISDTWEHDGIAWHKRDVANPPVRSSAVMAYDVKRERTVLFGGIGLSSGGQMAAPLDDLWEFDGTRWIERRATTAPPPRHSAGFAYDSRRGRVVIFGGIGQSGVLADTWAWDGEGWTALSTEGPGKRAMGYMAYDPIRDRIVLFGGRLGWPNDANDTWEFDGERWREVVSGSETTR